MSALVEFVLTPGSLIMLAVMAASMVLLAPAALQITRRRGQ